MGKNARHLSLLGMVTDTQLWFAAVIARIPLEGIMSMNSMKSLTLPSMTGFPLVSTKSSASLNKDPGTSESRGKTPLAPGSFALDVAKASGKICAQAGSLNRSEASAWEASGSPELLAKTPRPTWFWQR